MKLSYSAVSTLRSCGEKYRLGRVLGYRGAPSWAQIGGTIFHTAAETYENEQHGIDPPLTDVRRNWGLALDEQAHALTVDTEWSVDDIKATGRVVKSGISMSGGPNKKDRDWWVHMLPVMYQTYVNWSQANPMPLWITPDGVPALEIAFEFHTESGAHIRGFIDQVRVSGNSLVCIDHKTGMEPPGVDQLGLYRVGLAHAFPDAPPADWGLYYLAQDGSTSVPADLTGFTEERIEWEYGAAKERVERGDFQPHVSRDCGWCDCREWCIYQGGERAHEVPLPWPVKKA